MATKKVLLSRRQFLVLSAVVGVAGTGLVVGYDLYERSQNQAPVASGVPNVWLRIDADNSITIRVAKSEMGQGVLTALAMIVADELDADWAKVRVEQAPADMRFGVQSTSGSSSITSTFAFLRYLGAETRALLVSAAAQIWHVSASSCTTEPGAVVHLPTGRRLAYGQLPATVLSQQLTQANVRLKQPAQFRLIGTPVPRVDTPAKVDGSATFGLDVRVPGMLYAVVARCPVPGGSVAHFDDTAARHVPGVRQVIQISTGVAVVADHTWAAMRGREALQVSWNEGGNAGLDSAQIRRQLRTQAQQLAGGQHAAGSGERTVEAIYETPYLAHAAMEPMNCTADVRTDRCEVWVGTQDPQYAQSVAAQMSGLATTAVTVHVPFLGGGFGRRTVQTWVGEAVEISKAVRKPVQVLWTREDDIQQDTYRPASCHSMRAVLDSEGHLRSWQHHIAAQQINPLTTGAAIPYSIASTQVDGSAVSAGVPVGIWRSIEYSNNIFAIESFIDEIAAASHRDPYQLRLDLLHDQPRLRMVVQLAAAKAGWGTPLPAGSGRGMAVCSYQAPRTYVATVADIGVDGTGTVQVQRIVCAVDCGLVINPDVAQSQVEGSIIFGLSAALHGEIDLQRGRVQQSNFDDYPVIRMREAPAIEVYFAPATDVPSGLGEPAVPTVAPAVANAVFNATGRRVRHLPIRPEDLRWPSRSQAESHCTWILGP